MNRKRITCNYSRKISSCSCLSRQSDARCGKVMVSIETRLLEQDIDLASWWWSSSSSSWVFLKKHLNIDTTTNCSSSRRDGMVSSLDSPLVLLLLLRLFLIKSDRRTKTDSCRCCTRNCWAMHLIGELQCVPCCLMLCIVRVQLGILAGKFNRHHFGKRTFVSWGVRCSSCIIVRYGQTDRRNLSGERQDLFIFVRSTMNDSLFVQ